MKADLYIGIDPGASGAIAVVDAKGVFIECWDMPTVVTIINGRPKRRTMPEMLHAELKQYTGRCKAVVERVGPMPKQGVTSMFAFGEAFGLIRGVLIGMNIPCELVSPYVWRKSLRVPEGKDGSRARAAQMWPGAAKEFARKKDNGRAEASLIAEWGRLHLDL
jgi:crossover junction endodeoxyribonuclease RuvC